MAETTVTISTVILLVYIACIEAVEFEPELESNVETGGYVVIAIAVLIGLAMIAGLVFFIIKERKEQAQVRVSSPVPSGSQQKPSALIKAFSNASLTDKETCKIEDETKSSSSGAAQTDTPAKEKEDKETEEAVEKLLSEIEADTNPIGVAPKQTIQRSLSRSVIGTPEVLDRSRQSVMSNASVVTRQASCSSIMIRTSPDDAKRPESIRPDSTMVTVEEHPETLAEDTATTQSSPSPDNVQKVAVPLRRTMSKSSISPTTTSTTPSNKPMAKGVIPPVSASGKAKQSSTGIESTLEEEADDTGNSKSSPTPVEPSKPATQLKRTMSRSVITHAETVVKPMNRQMSRSVISSNVPEKKPMNRQMSRSVMSSNVPEKKPVNRQVTRAMSKAVLKLGEHEPLSEKSTTSDEKEGKEEENKTKEIHEPEAAEVNVGNDDKNQENPNVVEVSGNDDEHKPNQNDGGKEINEGKAAETEALEEEKTD